MFAIVTVNGKQYKVEPESTLEVERLEGNVGEILTFDQVLFLHDGKKIEVGRPTVKGHVLKAKILSQEKGEKINVRRFKSKVRYRRSRGFRPLLTKLSILSIAKS